MAESAASFLLHIRRDTSGLNWYIKKMYASLKNLRARHRIASEFQEIRLRLENVSNSRERFKDVHDGMNERSINTTYDTRGDALLLEESEVVGIEKPKKQLLDWLMESDDELKVISVVGMGGLGKTTLVKKIYDDSSVKANFHTRAWITVSENFNLELLLRNMIKHLTNEIKLLPPQSLQEMTGDEMKEYVYNFLKDKTYVIVIDDVWKVDAWKSSAVSTLAKFGAMVDSLKVRDRATLYLSTLGDGSVSETAKDVKEFLFGSLEVPLTNMETSLKNYIQNPTEEPFDIQSVPKEVKSQPLAEKKAPGKKPAGLGAPPATPSSAADAFEKLLSSIPEFRNFGSLLKSSAPVELTEAETEYAVNVVKHIFDRHVVFQYNCTNTIPEQLLENVTVFVDASEADEFSEVGSKPLRYLPYDIPAQTFVAFEKPEGVPAVGKFSNTLRFIVKEVDPSTGEAEDDGVKDEYQLEDFEVVDADYILKVGVTNFKNAWETLGPDFERVDEYGLGPRESLTEAVNAVINLLGMQPCEGTETVPNNSRSHTCLLSGVYIGNVKVLVRLSFGIDGTKEVAMKLAVRSENEIVSDAIHEIVASG